MKNTIWILCISVLALTGCVDREAADAKLAKACVAGAEAFLEDGFKIKEIKNRTYGDSHEFGKGFREVRVTVLESDDWLENDKEYRCVFAESMGLFGLSYDADIYQLKFDDTVLGKEGDKIVGSVQDFTKLGRAIDDSLGR